MELRKWKFFVIDLFHILYMYYVYVYVCVCVCIHMYVYMYMGFPGSSDGKDSACNVGNLGQPLCWEDTLQGEWQFTPVFLPGGFYEQRSLPG